MRQPHVRADPAEVLEVLGGAAAERLTAEGVLLERLREVGVQAYPPVARQRGCLAHQLGGDRERRAGCHRDPQHRVGRRVVVAVDGLGRGTERRIPVLDDVVRRQSALGAAEVHRAAAGMEPQPDPAGGVDLRREHVAAVAGEHVVVVGARRAPGAGQPTQAGGRRGADDLGVDPGPHGIELGEPAEQALLLREAPGGPLVEVVVGVHQAGRGQAAGAVDELVARCAGRRAAGPDRDDPIAVDDDVPVDVLRAGGVDGGDGTALDHRPHASPPRAARWTAAMMFS